MNHRWIQQFRESVFFLLNVKRNSVLQNKNQDEKTKQNKTNTYNRQAILCLKVNRLKTMVLLPIPIAIDLNK